MNGGAERLVLRGTVLVRVYVNHLELASVEEDCGL